MAKTPEKRNLNFLYNKYPLRKSLIIKRIFNEKHSLLPTIKYLRSQLILDREGLRFANVTETLLIREIYIEYCFPLLNHEFFIYLKEYFSQKEIKNVVELCCGSGWLSWWAKKYGINIVDSVDNFSWQRGFATYFDFVKKEDSIDYVAKKEKEEVDLYVLSWAPMNDVAYEIWLSMKKGQYLLFIGEGPGGCTANDSFFETVKDCEVDFLPHKKQIFKSFWGIHDYPQLYLKG